MRTRSQIQIVGFLLVAGMAGFNRAAAAQEIEGSTIYLRAIDTRGRIPSDVLEQAQAEVTRIYRVVGINAVWMDGPPPDTTNRPFRILIPHAGGAAFHEVPASTLGFTPFARDKRGIMAYILSDRVERASQKYDVDFALLLGHTIAHEIGHLLLPAGHSAAGLMKGDWNTQDFRLAADGQLLFTPLQVALIRARLSNSSAN